MAATGPGASIRMGVTGWIYEVTCCCYTVNDQISLNVRHYQISSVVGLGATQGEFATMMDGVMAPLYKLLTSSQARYRGIRVRGIWPLPSSAPCWDISNDGVGSVAGDMLAKQTSGIITLYTGYAGRKYRGRVYVGLPGETDNGPTALPTAGYVTNLQNIGTAWAAGRTPGAGGNTTGFLSVIYHRESHIGDYITGFTARSVWATQRRRGSYGRPNIVPF